MAQCILESGITSTLEIGWFFRKIQGLADKERFSANPRNGLRVVSVRGASGYYEIE